jgi:plastocyanin
MKTFVLTAAMAVGLSACAGTPQREHTIDIAPTQPVPAATPEPSVAAAPVAPVVATAPPVAPPAAVQATPPVVAPEPEAPIKPKPAKVVAAPAVVAAVPPPKPAPPVVEKKPVAEGIALKGHIDLVVGPDQTVGAGEVADTVVYFMPAVPVHPKPAQFQIYTRNKLFDPSSIVVPVGSTVTFPNQDQIIHNVFSASVGEEFDLGLYGEGGTAAHTFKKAGLAIINCNVHQAMQTNVLVVDTPYFTHPTRAGDFVLNGVPEGEGKLVIWHPRAASVERPLAIPATERTWTISITKPRVAGHLNKEHKAYQRDVSQQ